MIENLESVKAAAAEALKHSGKGKWNAYKRCVVGSVDVEGRKSFSVADVDPHDELPKCAGKAIAAYIEAAQPTVVLELIAEIERLALAAGEGVARAEAFAKSLHAEHCSKRAATTDLEPDGLLIDADGQRRPCEVCGEPATQIAGGDDMLPVCDVCIAFGEDPEDVVPCLACGLVDCACVEVADEEANRA